MILHLILALVNQAAKADAARADRRPEAPRSMFRNMPDEPVVMDCPHCHKIVVAKHDHVEEATAAAGYLTWVHVAETYQCPDCQCTLAAGQFENDGRGVLQIRIWQCPQCRNTNPVIDVRCRHCGKTQPQLAG